MCSVNFIAISPLHIFITSVQACICFCHLVVLNIVEIPSPAFRDTLPRNKMVIKGKFGRDGGTGLKVVGSPK